MLSWIILCKTATEHLGGSNVDRQLLSFSACSFAHWNFFNSEYVWYYYTKIRAAGDPPLQNSSRGTVVTSFLKSHFLVWWDYLRQELKLGLRWMIELMINHKRRSWGRKWSPLAKLVNHIRRTPIRAWTWSLTDLFRNELWNLNDLQAKLYATSFFFRINYMLLVTMFYFYIYLFI